MTDRPYTTGRICQLTGGHVSSSRPDDLPVEEILIDSRRLVEPAGCLFVALVTPRNDGHKYIRELYDKGVRSFLVSGMPEDRSLMPEGVFILVQDTLAALQALAADHRSRFSIPVIGITGSNGKTIVKEWLFQLLSPGFRIIRSPKSFNSQVGVPLSVWKMKEEHTLAIFEAGISQPGEMEHLEPVIRPTIGILTNIGSAHDEHFTDRRQKTAEKLKLFRQAGTLIFCKDDPVIEECLGIPEYKTLRRFTWSRIQPADLRVGDVRKSGETAEISARIGKQEFSVVIPFTDEASIENAIHCWCLMTVMGVAPATIAARLPLLTPIALRLELKEAINHCSLINDSYNSDINSLGIAVDFLIQQNQHPKKTVILSDLLQSGKDKAELYRGIGELFVAKKIDRFIGIGRDLVKNQDKFPMQKAFFATTDEFLSSFPLSEFRDETILLKGARLFEFEKIGLALQQKAHETVLEVNLDAMVHNLNHYRSKLLPGVKTMAMVKAFSYGSGSYEIANLLQFHRVDYLAVAYADEGVELRKAGIRLPVMVMSPEEHSLDQLLKYNLEPEIYNLHILGLVGKAVERNQTAIQEEVRIHLKLDTGMHRLGFLPGDLDELCIKLKENPRLKVQSVFSHLAASEDPGEDEFTRGQIARFEEMSNKITQTLTNPVLLHILNSAGISRFPGAQFSMVRLGIGLYGVGMDAEEQSLLRNVGTLKSVITQIKRIPEGETIGYNRKGIASRDTLMGIVPVGYADGLNRRLGLGNGALYVHGRPAPVIGNICMDLTMVDLTDIAQEGIGIREGDEVIIFGDLHPVADLASRIGTIPYEVLTTISRRVKRIYFHE
jgi:Alr-MurF fusion protein